MVCPDKYPANILADENPRWSIRLREKDLLWRPTAKTPNWRLQSVVELKSIWEFQSLGQEFAPERALRFAEKFGPLGICQHDKLYLHGAEYGVGVERGATIQPDAPVGERLRLDEQYNVWIKLPVHCSPRPVRLDDEIWFAERLTGWKNLAEAVSAMLEVIDCIRRERKTPTKEKLQILSDIRRYGFGPGREHYRLLDDERDDVDDSRHGALQLVNDLLNDWLLGAPVRRFCGIDPKTMKIELDEGIDDRLGVFPMVAAELSFLISNPGEGCLVRCDGCGVPFILVRKPPRGRRVVCPECRRLKIPERHAKRDSRRAHSKRRP